MRRYRRTLPWLARKILYPDAVDFTDLPAAHHDVRKEFSYSPEAVDTPDAPEMGFWPEAEEAAVPVYQPPEIFSARLRDVLFWPRYSLMLSGSRAVIRDSTSTVLPITLRGWSERLLSRTRRESGICTLFRGVHNNFYHTYIDNMARLHSLYFPPYNNIENIKLLISTTPSAQESYIFDKYLPRNVSVTVVGSKGLIEPDEMIFPSFPARRSLSYLPSSYLEHVLPYFVPDRAAFKRNRIYVARKESKRGRIRNIENQEALVRMLTQYGFQPYYLEDHSLQDQIGLFFDAEIVVAAHGAGLSNILFSQGIDVVELFPSKMTMPHYYYLALCKGHRYRYWRGDRAHFDDSFSVDISAVEALLHGLGYRDALERASS